MKGTSKSFRIGRVRGDLRGKVWYLTYHDNGTRHRPRVGPDREAARQLAAQINSQLEVGVPTALAFSPIAIAELQSRWLGQHEHVLCSSVQTIDRYRTATNHLLRFLDSTHLTLKTSQFGSHHAERFARYLRTVQVTPNGHPNAEHRPLLDKGVKYVLLTCRSMFNYAIKRRHLPPYTENPFSILDLDRIPVENSRPISLFTPDQERKFLEACDDWQLPMFLTLMLTGLRPGELTHLLLPDDVDLDGLLLRVRNKPRLGWQVKTRSERDIPIVKPLAAVLKVCIGKRATGPLFLRRRFNTHDSPTLCGASTSTLELELAKRVATWEREHDGSIARHELRAIARTLWRDAGAIETKRLRMEFMRLTKRIGQPDATAPKSLRHLFATSLQEGDVDPLIRCELMGHSTRASSGATHGLGMTATYTHTRLETKRRQLESALSARPAVSVAKRWFERKKVKTGHGVGVT